MKKLYLLFLPCLLLTLSTLSQKKEKPEEYPFMMKDITYLSDSTGAQTFYIQGLPMLQQTRHRIFFLGEERKGPAAGQ